MAFKKFDEIGIDRPIQDKLELDEFMPKDQGVEQEVTSEEESELGKHTEVLARRARADCRREHIPSTSRRRRVYPERRGKAESVRIETRRQHDLGGGTRHGPNQPKCQDWRSRR